MYPIHEPTLADGDGVERPTTVAVDLGAITHNLGVLRAHCAPARVLCILKANAYGHGLVPVARHLEAIGADGFGVAYLEEGVRLRQAGVRAPILVMGGIVGAQIPHFLRHELTLTASSVDKLLAIEDCAASLGQKAKVHLKIDTGMERLGVHWYSAPKLLEASLTCPNVEVEGIFSHFANADEADPWHARLQLERFHEVLGWYEDRSLPTPIRHISNSGGVIQLPEARLDLVRPGILLYGVFPSDGVPRDLPVRPAMTWTTTVTFFKVVLAGNPVSYGSVWAPERDTRVVTLPVGYGDGYVRALSNRSSVAIHGRRFPQRGRICMDQLMVDIGQESAYNGDEVVLLGGTGPSVEELARLAGTIPHEILTGINTRVPRRYVLPPGRS
jgi:alanine racemase